MSDKREITQKERIDIYTEAIARMQYAKGLGMTYDDARDIYQALGYTLEVKYQDYYNRYKRQDIASAIINRPVNTTWVGGFQIKAVGEENSDFENDINTIIEDFDLKSVFRRTDKLASIGRYAIIFLGLSDDKQLHLPAVPGSELIYIKPLSEGQATITKTDSNPKSKRFGMPELYSCKINDSLTVNVHYTRCIHVVLDVLDDEVYGIPTLEKVYNRLQDVERIVGGSSEMFWRGARPGYQGVFDKEYKSTEGLEDAMMAQLDEYEHNLRRILMQEGVEFKPLAMQVASPKDHLDVQIQMISAGTNTPKRMLTGSELGELASTQDKENWYTYIQGRREEVIEPDIINKVIDSLIELRIVSNLPEGVKYETIWKDLNTVNKKELAEVGKIRTEAIVAYSNGIGSQDLIQPEQFFKLILGMDDAEVDIILEGIRSLPAETEPTPQERQIIESEENN